MVPFPDEDAISPPDSTAEALSGIATAVVLPVPDVLSGPC